MQALQDIHSFVHCSSCLSNNHMLCCKCILNFSYFFSFIENWTNNIFQNISITESIINSEHLC